MKPEEFKTKEEATIILKKFIKQQQKKGLTDKQITKKLVEEGFDNDILEQLFPDKYPKEKMEDIIAKGIFKGFGQIIGLIILIWVLFRLFMHLFN